MKKKNFFKTLDGAIKGFDIPDDASIMSIYFDEGLLCISVIIDGEPSIFRSFNKSYGKYTPVEE